MGGGIIADVRPAWFRLHVVTRYRVRTPVERWQIQDRLRVRLARMGHRGRIRFYEMPDGRLACAVWTGLRADAQLVDRLRTIDREDGG